MPKGVIRLRNDDTDSGRLQAVLDGLCVLDRVYEVQTNASISSSNCRGVIDRARIVVSRSSRVGLVLAHTLAQVVVQSVAVLTDDLDKAMELLLPPLQCAYMRLVRNFG